MIWQAPWAWLGLATIAIPVVIHLLTRREARRIRVPTLRFFERSESSAIRFHHLTDPVLLAVRAGLIAAAVAALAQPYVTLGARVAGQASIVSRAIVIDSSASMARAQGGTSPLASARAQARALQPNATITSTIESATLRAGVARAEAWLASAPGRREIVVLSDFKLGAIDAGDLQSMGAGIGLRFVKVATVEERLVTGPPDHVSGHRIVPQIDVTPDWTEVRWVETPETAGAPGSVRILRGPGEERASAAALEAVSTIGIPAGAPDHPTVIVLPEAAERASLLSRARPIDQPWMFDVVSRLNATDDPPRPSTSSAIVNGTTSLLIVPNSAEPVALARILSATLNVTGAGSPITELEPLSLSSATLRAWERPADSMPARVVPPTDASDGRWLWALALGLLGLETWLGRGLKGGEGERVRGQREDAAALHAFLARAWRRLTLGRVLDGVFVGAMAATVAMLILRAAGPLRLGLVPAFALMAAGAAVQLRRALASRPRVAFDVERRAPQFQNLLVTSAELMTSIPATRPEIASLVFNRTLAIASAVDPRALFPSGRPALRSTAMTTLTVATYLLISHAAGAATSRLVPVTAPAALQHISVTITPPAYTHLPSQLLRDPSDVRAIAGSHLLLRVQAIADRVSLDMLETHLAFTRESADGFTAAVVVDRDGYLAIEPTSVAGAGPRRLIGLTIDPDRAPTVRVMQPGHDLFLADVAARRLPIDIAADDDIGLTALRVKYTKVSGSGEDFTFKEGELPLRLTRENDRHWTASATLDLGALGLELGDMVVYRALAADARPGAAATESDAFIVQVVNPDQAAASGFAADDDPNRFAISERMIILKTEQLIARRSTLPAEAFADQAQGIAAEQRHVRAEFIFMMGGEMEDLAAVADTLDETAEAAREDELAAGRLQNRGAVDLIFATRHMSHAADALGRPDAPAALTAEKAALAALQRAFTKSRYLLRSLSTQERLDMTRRLTGTLAGLARDTRPPVESPETARTVDLRRALAGIASFSASATGPSAAARAATLAEGVMRINPSDPALRAVAKSLSDAAPLLTSGRLVESASLIDKAAIDLAAIIRSGSEDAPRVDGWPARRLNGAIADVLRRGSRR